MYIDNTAQFEICSTLYIYMYNYSLWLSERMQHTNNMRHAETEPKATIAVAWCCCICSALYVCVCVL